MRLIQSRLLAAASSLCLIPVFTFAATISGTITGPMAGSPLPNAQVVLYDVDFRSIVAQTTTDASGNYNFTIAIDGAASNGNLLVEAAAPGFAGGRHNSAMMLNCFFGCASDVNGIINTDGMLVVADADALTGIDINLQAGAVLSGTVTDAATTAGIDGSVVTVVNEFGFEFVGIEGVTSASGDYQINAGLAPGEYTLLARDDAGGRVAQANNSVDCEAGACPLVHRTPIEITNADPILGVDFSLRAGGTISGQIQEAPGVPLSANGIVRIYAPSGNRTIDSVIVPAGTGNYEFTGLEGGSYYLEYDPFPSTQTNFVRLLHNGELCPFSGCDRNAGAPFNLTPGTTVSSLDIVLPEGGKISGTIVDASTSMPIALQPDSLGLGLTIVNTSGVVVGAGIITDPATGTWTSGDGLPAGSYFVRTGFDFFGLPVGQSYDGFVDQLFGGSDCEGLVCDFSGVSPTAVTTGATTTGVDLMLSSGSSIEGTVVDAISMNPLPNLVFVLVYNQSGVLVGQEQVQPDGSYRFSALPAGNYFARTQVAGKVFAGFSNINGNPYFDAVFGVMGDCAGELCDPTAGTMIVLDGTTDVTGINFELNTGPTVSGTITNTTTGLAVFGEAIVETVGGELVNRYRVNPSTGLFTTGALPPGMYTLNSDVSDAFVDPGTATTRQFGAQQGLTFTVVDQDVTGLDLPASEIYIHGDGFEVR